MREFNYGGQAVIEGVMIRGRRHVAVAIRKRSGEILLRSQPLRGAIYTARWARLPFLRGLVLLWDALVLGTKMLLFSAEVALAEEGEAVELGGSRAWGTLLLSLALGLGLFFLFPAWVTRLMDQFLTSSLLSSFVEGTIRLVLLIAYLGLLGSWPEVQRVFAYHGAEHKTINAYEDGARLEPAAVKPYSTGHSRCGTGFLLVVVVVAIALFALLGRPPLLSRLISRFVLIPVIAGLSYEVVRLASRRKRSPLGRAVLAPSLALQRLSTREPTIPMLEVAIAALKKVLEQEGEGPRI